MADSKLSNIASQLESFDPDDAKKEMTGFYNMLKSAPSLPMGLINKYMSMTQVERQQFLQNPSIQAELSKYLQSAMKITSEAERLQSKFENVLGSQNVVNKAIAESQQQQLKQMNPQDKKA